MKALDSDLYWITLLYSVFALFVHLAFGLGNRIEEWRRHQRGGTSLSPFTRPRAQANMRAAVGAFVLFVVSAYVFVVVLGYGTGDGDHTEAEIASDIDKCTVALIGAWAVYCGCLAWAIRGWQRAARS